MNKRRATGLVFAGILIGACAHTAAPLLVSRAAGNHRCDYTHIFDTGAPNIGQVGQIAYDDDWKIVLGGGFSAQSDNGADLRVRALSVTRLPAT